MTGRDRNRRGQRHKTRAHHDRPRHDNARGSRGPALGWKREVDRGIKRGPCSSPFRLPSFEVRGQGRRLDHQLPGNGPKGRTHPRSPVTGHSLAPTRETFTSATKAVEKRRSKRWTMDGRRGSWVWGMVAKEEETQRTRSAQETLGRHLKDTHSFATSEGPLQIAKFAEPNEMI